MTLVSSGIWCDINECQPGVGEPVLVIVLLRHTNRDWAWEPPRIDTLNEKGEWVRGCVRGVNLRPTTLWARIQVPPLPDCPERQEAIESARRYTALRARQTALDREFSEEFRRQMFGRDEATKETA